MKRHALGLLLGIAFCAGTLAQDANPHDGKWLIKISLNDYRGEADLVVSGKEGTYRRIVVGTSGDACAGRVAPIEVTKATPDEFEYKIYGSRALRGCQDGEVKARRMADGTFEGTVSPNGAKFVHVRR